jgi:hypothetical protein
MKTFCRSAFVTLAMAGSSALLFAGSALAAELSIPMNEVRMMTFRAPVRTVVVGNPVIADVSVVDERHIVVLGKNIGSTNLVVLNADGQQVANELIAVHGQTSSVVTLQRGAAQTTLACGGDRCHQVPLPGDAPDPYEAIAEQIGAREAAARAAAGAVAETQAAAGEPP